jgi:hypothetical protein
MEGDCSDKKKGLLQEMLLLENMEMFLLVRLFVIDQTTPNLLVQE